MYEGPASAQKAQYVVGDVCGGPEELSMNSTVVDGIPVQERGWVTGDLGYSKRDALPML